MEDYVINFISIKYSTTLFLNGLGLGPFMKKFFQSFKYDQNPDGGYVINALQEVTDSLMQQIEELIDEYKERVPQVQQLRAVFKRIGLHELFFMIPADVPKDQADHLVGYLCSLKDPNPEESFTQLKSIKQQIEANYSIYQYSSDVYRKIFIGEQDKTKLVCRYCKRKVGDVSFKEIAHTISEALGNKRLFTTTECDECNNKYGTGIEMDFANYHQFLRLFYGIQGKKRIDTSVGNYQLERDDVSGDIKISVKLTDEQIEEMKEREDAGIHDIHLPIEIGQNFKPINIYKALCKYVIGILPDVEVDKFNSTIEWMDGKKIFTSLPNVARFFPTNFRLSAPRISLFVKHTEKKELPFAIGIVEFSDIAYAFVVPVSEDTIDYKKGDILNDIKEEFPVFDFSKGWQFIDFNDDGNIPIKNNISFVKS